LAWQTVDWDGTRGFRKPERLMEGFFLFSIIGLAVAGAVVASAAKKRAAANEAWREAASRLRLLFKPGDLLTSPQMVGTLRGCQVSVRSFTKSSDKAKWTRYQVEFRTPHRASLQIRQQGLLAGIRKAFGQPDVEFGDAEFDARLEVRAGDPAGIREFLNPLRRRRLLELFDEHPGLVIEGRQLTWEVKGLQAASGRIVDAIERLVAAAEDLSPDEPAASPVPTGAPIVDRERTGLPRRLPPIVLRASAAPSPSRERTAAPGSASPATSREARRATPTARTTSAAPGPTAEAASPGPASPASQRAGTDAGDAPGPAVASVSVDLFGVDTVSYEVPKLFAERYRAQMIRWSGELRTVSRYPFDRVFGNAPGTRATFVVHQMETPLGRRPVQAVVQLPVGAIDRLRTEVGKLFVFEGRLVDCDSFMRTIFVGDGQVVWARPDSHAGDRS
jgi:hypothetical protein